MMYIVFRTKRKRIYTTDFVKEKGTTSAVPFFAPPLGLEPRTL